MTTKSQFGFEQIKISDELDEVIKEAIERAKKEKKEKSLSQIQLSWLKATSLY